MQGRSREAVMFQRANCKKAEVLSIFPWKEKDNQQEQLKRDLEEVQVRFRHVSKHSNECRRELKLSWTIFHHFANRRRVQKSLERCPKVPRRFVFQRIEQSSNPFLEAKKTHSFPSHFRSLPRRGENHPRLGGVLGIGDKPLVFTCAALQSRKERRKR